MAVEWFERSKVAPRNGGEWNQDYLCLRNKVLDVSGGATANGSNVHLWSYNGSSAQDWRAISAERPAKIGYQNPANYPQVSSLTVKLPSYCTGEFIYVTPSRIAIDATRDDCVDAFIQRAYEYVGTRYIEPYSTAPAVPSIVRVLYCNAFMLQVWIWESPTRTAIAGLLGKPTTL